MKSLTSLLTCFCCWLLASPDATAFSLPQTRNVRIELHYDLPKSTNEIGATLTKAIVPYTYFMLNDIYTDEEKKVSSDSYSSSVTVFDFDINHPLYDCILSGGNVKIPFYVEPGDTLIINLTKAGKVTSYARKNGGAVECDNLLRHDFSNNILYSQKEYETDKKEGQYADFVKRVTVKMNHQLDSLSQVADKFGFSAKERQVAANNIKIQFAHWLFAYARLGAQQSAIEGSGIADVKNYAFFKGLPLDDSTCVASRYFSRFMNSYEHSYFLNSDQKKFYGTSLHAQARMDSAFIAKDLEMTGAGFPSFFMEMAMIRRHFDASTMDDGSVRLHEVKVIGHQAQLAKPVTPEDMIKWRGDQKPTTAEQIASPSYWLFGRKRYRNQKRAKALIDKIAEEDDAKDAERDALLKAYEEETGHKYEGK